MYIYTNDMIYIHMMYIYLLKYVNVVLIRATYVEGLLTEQE